MRFILVIVFVLAASGSANPANRDFVPEQLPIVRVKVVIKSVRIIFGEKYSFAVPNPQGGESQSRAFTKLHWSAKWWWNDPNLAAGDRVQRLSLRELDYELQVELLLWFRSFPSLKYVLHELGHLALGITSLLNSDYLHSFTEISEARFPVDHEAKQQSRQLADKEIDARLTTAFRAMDSRAQGNQDFYDQLTQHGDAIYPSSLQAFIMTLKK